MRRMTASELAYYAEKQKEADKRETKKSMCHGIMALIAILIVPVIAVATEINLLHVCVSAAISVFVLSIILNN